MESTVARAYALIVGIEVQRDALLGSAECAASNARTFVELLLSAGYQPNNCTILINERATQHNIQSELQAFINRVRKGDQFIIYFSGRGLFQNGRGYLLAQDSKLSASSSALKLQQLFRLLDRCKSPEVTMFIDLWLPGLCPSALKPGSRVIKPSDLKCLLGRKASRIGFLSCRDGEISHNSSLMPLSLWMFELLRFAGANAFARFRDSRLSLTDTLTRHLSRAVQQRLKDEHPGIRIQTPITLRGSDCHPPVSCTDNNAAIEPVPLPIGHEIRLGVFSTIGKGYIQTLPGFSPETHSVPQQSSASASILVATLSQDKFSNQISILERKIRNALGYSRSDLKISIACNHGRIRTPHFDLTLNIDQVKSEPTRYYTALELTSLAPHLISDAKFNRLFQGSFSQLSLPFIAPLDITWLAKRLERENNPTISKLDTTNPRICRIRFKGHRNWTLRITKSDARIKMKNRPPSDLASAFEYASRASLFGQFAFRTFLRRW